MSLARSTDRADPGTTILQHLQGSRRRTLAALLDRDGPVSVGELTADLAVSAQREHRAIHIDLVHRHLPALEDAGLVAWDRDAGTVATTEDPALGDPDLRRFIGREDGLAETIDCLADEQRRTVLAVLGREGAASRRTLARAVSEREADGEPSPDAVEDALVTLHHVHLPKLADAGLVEYDAETGTVAPGDRRSYGSVMALFSDE
jgi:DNA-binding transcriptional ArsR family regulator